MRDSASGRASPNGLAAYLATVFSAPVIFEQNIRQRIHPTTQSGLKKRKYDTISQIICSFANNFGEV
jgi:hypothetical protein